MLKWLSTQKTFLSQCGLQVNEPATEADIAGIEEELRISLPSSYKAFLRISNGIEEYGIYGSIFSTEKLLEYVRKYGFTSWDGTLKAVGTADLPITFTCLPERQLEPG